MPDDSHYNANTVESTSPLNPFTVFAPIEYRRMIQSQISRTVNRVVNQAVSFSVRGQDGRYLSSMPGTYIKRENDDGFLFHMVGTNRGGDLSVAAP